jgi:magnesium transporter
VSASEPPWVDLLDPDEATIRANAPVELHPSAVARLARAADRPRPSIEGHGSYVIAVLLVAVAVPEEDRVFYQEVDLVVTPDRLMLVRKTPPGERPYDSAEAAAACAPGESPAMHALHVVDTIAEHYLALVDALNAEIDELEDHVDDWSAAKIRTRLSELRHDLLHIRQTLAPTREAVRRIVDGRIDTAGPEIFTRDVELHFGDVYDKLLQAADGLELSRDLVAGVRDYHQAQIANSQNEAMKRLTAIASILLLPTFIVGLYGQNFEHIPELGWGLGYWWSWGWIIASTVGQLAFFRWKRWL